MLVAIVAIVGVGLVGYIGFTSLTAAAYTCDSLLEAPPSQVSDPRPGETVARLGFPVSDQGTTHTDAAIAYATCPPTSGEHRSGGVLPRDFYGPESIQIPNDWVHNLEHGYAVIAYSGEPEPDTFDQIRAAMEDAQPSEVAVGCGMPNKVIALRFDDMSSPYAVLAWDWAYLMEDFDQESMTSAATQFQDMPQAPEQAC